MLNELLSLVCNGQQLTELPATNRHGLLCINGACAILCRQELYKPVRLLDRDLRQSPVFVEDMEKVPLCDLLCGQVAWGCQRLSSTPVTHKLTNEEP